MAHLSFQALTDRNAARLVAAQLLSQLCDRLMLVAVMWLLADKYDVAWVPWYAAAGGLPHVALTWWAGRIINRIGGLRIVILSDLVRGMLFIAFPVLIATDQPPVAALIGLTVAANIAGALFNPAMLALPLEIVRDELRPQVNAMIDTCFSVAAVLGPALSVILYAKVGLRGLILINGLSYLIAGLVQLGITPVRPESGEVRSAAGRGGLPSPLAILRRESLVRAIFGIFLVINFFGAPFAMYMPLYVKQVYLGQLGTLASLEVALGVGALCGALTLAVVSAGGRLGWRIILGVLGVALAFGAFALSRTHLAGLASVFTVGIFMALSNVWILTYFQGAVPPQEAPVVMSLVNFISLAAVPASMGIAGLMVESVPVTWMAAGSAAAVIAAALGMLVIPRLKEV